MELNVAKLRSKEGKPVEVSGVVDIQELEYHLDKVDLPEPVKVEGVAVFRDGNVNLSIDITSVASQHCRRCLTPIDVDIDRHEELEFRADIELEVTSEGNVSIYRYSGEDSLDLDQYVKSFLSLDLEPYPLCQQDCAGLCPHCGADLNEVGKDHQCQEDSEETSAKDPRMEKLADLL
ncbi:MAG: YceD family protein [Candidatus Bipolaricaulota bacterium]